MSFSAKTNYFGNVFLDRQSDLRKDQKWLSDEMRSPKSVYVLFHVDRPFMKEYDDSTVGLAKLTYEKVKLFLDNDDKKSPSKCNWMFLGVEYEKNVTQSKSERGDEESLNNQVWSIRSPYSNLNDYYNPEQFKSWFAIDTSGFSEDPEKVAMIFDSAGKFLEGNFLRIMATHDVFESSVIAQARSVFCWIDRNKYCATCGQPNKLSEGGYKLACTNSDTCKSHSRQANKHVPSNIHYPRVDPVAIMLIISPDNEHILLGRKKAFPGRMFSCLAGYVEPGESLEETVRRETYEECGIRCDRVEYHSSQPWPFPSTLMLGCVAYAHTSDIKVDGVEIAEARWFSRDDIEKIILNKHPDDITIPPDRAIANRLITYWCKHMISKL